jgi:hypothetical protein
MRPQIQDVLVTTGRYFKVHMADLVGPSRRMCFARPRQIAMYMACLVTELSSTQIGTAVGERDHSTVLHAERVITSLVATDPQILLAVNLIRERLNRDFFGAAQDMTLEEIRARSNAEWVVCRFLGWIATGTINEPPKPVAPPKITVKPSNPFKYYVPFPAKPPQREYVRPAYLPPLSASIVPTALQCMRGR